MEYRQIPQKGLYNRLKDYSISFKLVHVLAKIHVRTAFYQAIFKIEPSETLISIGCMQWNKLKQRMVPSTFYLGIEAAMRLTDSFGFEVTVDSNIALETWNKLVLSFLSHSTDIAEHLESALTQHEIFPMAHIAKGYFHMLLGRRELVDTAKQSCAAATKISQNTAITEREELYLAGLRHLTSGQFTKSANQLLNLLKKFPEDGFAVKLVHSIQFMLGDAIGMRSTLEGILHSYAEANPAIGYVNGCYAFALEETGEYEKATRHGKLALEFAKDDVWGLHAVAHVYDMKGQDREGIQWLSSHSESWVNCNNFRFHCWWHLALLYLDCQDYEKVLALYDKEIRKDRTDDYRDIANGVSLLTRLEIEGIDVGGRWEELVSLSEKRINDNCVVFADFHYLIPLLAKNRIETAQQLKSNIANLAENGDGDMAAVARMVGIPVVNGLSSYFAGNYSDAFYELASVRSKIKNIGGSHAQRDVFDRLTIEAAIKSGQTQAAIDLLDTRTQKRGGVDGYAERRYTVLQQLNDISSSTGDLEYAHLAI